jgi:hypothetical protein
LKRIQRLKESKGQVYIFLSSVLQYLIIFITIGLADILVLLSNNPNCSLDDSTCTFRTVTKVLFDVSMPVLVFTMSYQIRVNLES